jgi:hypothetical protein
MVPVLVICSMFVELFKWSRMGSYNTVVAIYDVERSRYQGGTVFETVAALVACGLYVSKCNDVGITYPETPGRNLPVLILLSILPAVHCIFYNGIIQQRIHIVSVRNY